MPVDLLYNYDAIILKFSLVLIDSHFWKVVNITLSMSIKVSSVEDYIRH